MNNDDLIKQIQQMRIDKLAGKNIKHNPGKTRAQAKKEGENIVNTANAAKKSPTRKSSRVKKPKNTGANTGANTKKNKRASFTNIDPIFKNIDDETIVSLRNITALNRYIQEKYKDSLNSQETIKQQPGTLYTFMGYTKNEEATHLNALKYMKRIQTSGNASDCLIHTFLTDTCEAFRKLPDKALKNSVARSFRVDLYTKFKETAEAMKEKEHRDRILTPGEFLDDSDIARLANIYNIDFLVFQSPVLDEGQPAMITLVGKGNTKHWYTIANNGNVHFESVRQEDGGFTVSNTVGENLIEAGMHAAFSSASGGGRNQSRKNHFSYHSEQTHSAFENGQGHTRRNIVSIDSGKGAKAVEVYDSSGELQSKVKKALTKKELNCIRRNQFIPGLFKDCMGSTAARATRRRIKRAS